MHGMADAAYWITPIGGDQKKSGESIVRSMVGKRKLNGLGRITPCSKSMIRGDWICFYATGEGIVGYARLTDSPKFEPATLPLYPYVFRLVDISLYPPSPKLLDPNTRKLLDAFKSRSQEGWGWFVTTTRRLSKHDFTLLTSD